MPAGCGQPAGPLGWSGEALGSIAVGGRAAQEPELALGPRATSSPTTGTVGLSLGPGPMPAGSPVTGRCDMVRAQGVLAAIAGPRAARGLTLANPWPGPLGRPLDLAAERNGCWGWAWTFSCTR